MISDAERKQIINLIWRGYSGLAIIEEFSPTGDRAERELSDAVSALRSEIEKFVKEVPGLIELGLRNGFSAKEVFTTITEQGQGLIPEFELRCKISGVEKKLFDEGAPAREALEKAASEARLAAIQKRIDDARQSLLDSGLPC